MPRRDLSYLTDVLEAAKLVQSFVKGVDRQKFEKDLMMQSAVIRQMEIIGKATKRLSEEFKSKHPHVPWRKIAGMRDILIHAYDHVDLNEVWNAAQASIPVLIKHIEPLASSLGKTDL